MFAIGLSLTFKQVEEPLRNRSLMFKSILLNLIILPGMALLLSLLFNLGVGLAVGFLLMSMSPAAPIGPKLTQIARSDVAYAAALMFLFSSAAVFTVPITAAIILPIEVYVDPLPIFIILALYQLLPLIVGLILRAKKPSISDSLFKIVNKVSNISLILVIILLLVFNLDRLGGDLSLSFFAVSAILMAISFILGYLLGGQKTKMRETLAITTLQRNAAIALLIATTSFSLLPEAAISTIIYGAITILIGLSIVAFMARKNKPKQQLK
jgi:BASS family bile acid:Na+ symporter